MWHLRKLNCSFAPKLPVVCSIEAIKVLNQNFQSYLLFILLFLFLFYYFSKYKHTFYYVETNILKNSPQKMLFSHLPIFFLFFNTPDIKDIITLYLNFTQVCRQCSIYVFFCVCKLHVHIATNRYQIAFVLHSPLKFHQYWLPC